MHRCSTSNLIHIYNMTHSYVRHVSFIRVTWLIHTCDMTHSYVRRDSSIRVTWLMYTCNMTHSYVRHDSFICEVALQLKQATHNHVSTSMCLYPPSFMHRGILTKSLSALSHLTVPCNHTLYASPTYTQKEPYINSKRALHTLQKSLTSRGILQVVQVALQLNEATHNQVSTSETLRRYLMHRWDTWCIEAFFLKSLSAVWPLT